SHLTNSIVVTSYAEKLSTISQAVNYLTNLNSVLTRRRLNLVTKKSLRMNTKDRGDDYGKDQREILRMGQTAADASAHATSGKLRLPVSYIRRPGEVSAAAVSAIRSDRKRDIRRSAKNARGDWVRSWCHCP